MSAKINLRVVVQTAQNLWNKAGEQLTGLAGRFKSRKVSVAKPASYLQGMANKVGQELEGRSDFKNRKITLSSIPAEPTMRRSQSLPELNSSKSEALYPLRRAASVDFEGAGGHAKTFVALGDSHIAKRTSTDENNVYHNRTNLGLDNILARHEAPESKFVRSLSEAESSSIAELKEALSPNESILVLEKLGAGIDTANKRELDIKIGHATASKTQLKASGHKTPLKKKMRMKLFDKLTKTSQRGYRFVGGKVHGEKVAGSRLRLGRATESTLAKTLDLPKENAKANLSKVIDDLKTIRQTMAEADVTFVDSSVLMMVDDQNPENTSVKIIDFGNPIFPDSTSDFDKIQTRYLDGLGSLIAEMELHYELYDLTE